MFLASSLSFSQDTEFSEHAKEYFLELAFGTDFMLGFTPNGINNNREPDTIKKWVYYVKIFVEGEVPTYLQIELDEAIDELNELTNNIKLKIAPEKESSNLLIYFGTADDYANKFVEDSYYAPPKNSSLSIGQMEKVKEDLKTQISTIAEDNWGISWTYWDDKCRILKGSILVDTERIDTTSAGKHILRENLAKSLGILYESNRYEKSIFYKDWSTTIIFQPIDKEVIQILYNDKIKPGMTRKEVIETLDDM
jgi:hypothetical protein